MSSSPTPVVLAGQAILTPSTTTLPPATSTLLNPRALGAYSTSNPSTLSVLPSALFQSAVDSSSSSFDLFPTGAAASSSSSSFDLFPTGYTTSSAGGNGTSSSGSGGSSDGGGPAPSLYLIVFLSVLVLLLVTSVSVALRAIIVRRRSRSIIQRAIARGELPPSAAAGFNGAGAGGWRAWFGWPDEEDDDEVREMVLAWHAADGGGGPTGGATGRRRRGVKLGPPPKLFEYALVDGDKADREDMMEIDDKQRWYRKKPPMSATIIKRAPPMTAIDSSIVEQPGGNGSATASTTSPPPLPPSSSPPPRSRYHISRPLHLEPAVTSSQIAAARSSTTATGPPTAISPGDTLSLSYIIAMPEPPSATAARRARLEFVEDDEDGAAGHGPMELGVALMEVIEESPGS